MTEESNVELLFTVPFDYSLFIEPALLGSIRPIQLKSRKARIEFPREIPKSQITRGLLRPISALEGIDTHLPEGWGLRDVAEPEVSIAAILIAIPVRTILSFELAATKIGGDDVHATQEEVAEWFESFCHWLWILTAQSLHPLNPDPKVLPRQSMNLIVAAATSSESSLLASSSPTLVISECGDGPACERLVNTCVLDLAAVRAGTGKAPMSLELLASARMAARRGDGRRALTDSGTAVEAALSRILGLQSNHQHTLGSLVKLASKNGVNIPADTQASLIDLRNDAVHRGQLRFGADVSHALELAERIVSLVELDLIPVSSLRPVNRPQCHDLVFIT